MRFWVLTDLCIHPQRASSQLHVWQVIEGLLRLGHAVSYGYLAESPPPPQMFTALAQRHRQFQFAGLFDPDTVPEFDVLYLTNLWSVETLQAGLAAVKQLKRDRRQRFVSVFDSMDCLFKSVGPFLPDPQRQAARQIETLLRREVDHSVLVSEQEIIEAIPAFGLPRERYSVVAQAYDTYPPGFSRGWAQRQNICFVGAINPANIQAIDYFLNQVFPRLLPILPRLEFHVLGTGTNKLKLNYPISALDRVKLRGYIPDIESAIVEYRLQVVPLLNGSGIKGKILQSLSCGTPVVATGKAVEGMDLLEGHDVVTGDTPETLAQAVLDVHGDAARWKSLQAGGEEYINRRYSFSVLDQQLIALTQKLRPA